VRELTEILGWDGRMLRIVREKRRAFTPV
jgi:hypothetical protein